MFFFLHTSSAVSWLQLVCREEEEEDGDEGYNSARLEITFALFIHYSYSYYILFIHYFIASALFLEHKRTRAWRWSTNCSQDRSCCITPLTQSWPPSTWGGGGIRTAENHFELLWWTFSKMFHPAESLFNFDFQGVLQVVCSVTTCDVASFHS